VLALARYGNEYFDKQAPWKQVKEDRAAADNTMGTVLDLLNALKVLFAPFLPHTSAKLHGYLGYDSSLEEAGWHFEPVPPGGVLPALQPLFRKLDVPAPASA
jgi:methionyl-tRNA synthetase